jgi:hypothetical protein
MGTPIGQVTIEIKERSEQIGGLHGDEFSVWIYSTSKHRRAKTDLRKGGRDFATAD